jgi:hypothetical protein
VSWDPALGAGSVGGEVDHLAIREATFVDDSPTRRMRPRSHSAHVTGSVDEGVTVQRRDRSFSDPVPVTPSPDAKVLAEELYEYFVEYYDSPDNPRDSYSIKDELRMFFDSYRGMSSSTKSSVYRECYGLLCRDMLDAQEELEKADSRKQAVQNIYNKLGLIAAEFIALGVKCLEKQELEENQGLTDQELFDFLDERAACFLEQQADYTGRGRSL